MSTQGPSQNGSTGQPPPAVSRTTRSSTKASVPSTTEGKTQSLNTKKAKPATVGEQARRILADKNCAPAESQATPDDIFKIFKKILEKYNSVVLEDLYETLQAFAILLQENASREQLNRKSIEAVAQRLEDKIEAYVESNLCKMSTAVESLIANQKTLQLSSSTLANTTETLQKIAQEMDNSAKETSATSSQLSTTITTYKEALLSMGRSDTCATIAVPGSSPDSQSNPRLARDLDCKQRQILLEANKDFVEGKSTAELKERIDTALNSITLPPPAGAKTLEINKLRNGGMVLQLASKEAATWLQDPSNRAAFMSKLDADAHIVDRTYPVVVPVDTDRLSRIPV